MSKGIGMMAFAMSENLHMINDHMCAGCLDAATEAAVQVTATMQQAVGANPVQFEALIDDVADTNSDYVETLLHDHGVVASLEPAIGFMAAYNTQVRLVDEMFADQHPLARVAFLAQMLRGMLYGTVAATMQEAESEGHTEAKTPPNASAAKLVFKHAIDAPAMGFTQWVAGYGAAHVSPPPVAVPERRKSGIGMIEIEVSDDSDETIATRVQQEIQAKGGPLIELERLIGAIKQARDRGVSSLSSSNK